MQRRKRFSAKAYPSRSMAWTKRKLDYAKFKDIEPYLSDITIVGVGMAYGNTTEYFAIFKEAGRGTISKRIYDKIQAIPCKY